MPLGRYGWTYLHRVYDNWAGIKFKVETCRALAVFKDLNCCVILRFKVIRSVELSSVTSVKFIKSDVYKNEIPSYDTRF